MATKKNYIINCENEEQSELVQIKILGLGYAWSEGGKLIAHRDKPVLIFDNLNNEERSISYHNRQMSLDYKQYSCYKKHKIISALEFLKLKSV